MADFLLELRSEEIPARMQAGARADLERLFRKEMDGAGLAVGALTVWSTPRRLTLIARDLPLATQAVSEETKGPRTSAPEQALEGFLRKTGLSKDQLTERDGVWFAVVEKPGRAASDVLAEAIPGIIRAFPWPKSQRWGAASLQPESLRWVRPLSGIIALLGGEVVPCEIGGIRSGRSTMGHRFHHGGEIVIDGVDDYAAKLRDAYVIVDHAEREGIVREGAKQAAAAAGLVLVEDEGLVIENAGLTEWPVPLLGRFDEAFLEVPPEVIQLTARVNQKYFVCTYPPRAGEGDHAQHGGGGSLHTPREGDSPLHHPAGGPPPRTGEDARLADAFVCTANIAARDGGGMIVAGNRKVLAARLSDARFFWEQDKKKPLSVHAETLGRITFHEKLGTVADKVERVAALARWLVEEGIVTGAPAQAGASGGSAQPTEVPAFAGTREELAAQAELAAKLCKADLVTEMVGEFPELQGLMGGYYARAEGLPDAVAEAIRDHYKPVGQGDDVPTAPVTAAVALADKLDTLACFFTIGEKPTGSRDPFALRRAALGIIRILQENGLRVALTLPLAMSIALLLARRTASADSEALAAGIGHLGLAGVRFDEETLDGLRQLIAQNRAAQAGPVYDAVIAPVGTELLTFLADRLKVQQREAGVRHDLIDAVFALGGEDDLVRLLARVHALQAFVGTEDGANLLAGYKRAANILRKSDNDQTAGAHGEGVVPPTGEEDPLVLVDDPAFAGIAAQFGRAIAEYEREPAEAALAEALAGAEPRAAAAVAAEDFTAAMAALASLRGPIDAFFDTVTVNDADANKRSCRLALLDQFRAAVHKVADFSRIEG